MRNRVCIIAVWFGKLPEYLEFWECSCVANKENADFLLVTDQAYNSQFPNIKVINTTMAELTELIGQVLNLPIAITKPFKMCDFRPTYGIIFNDILNGYEYWGHCDLDQVFGDLGILLKKENLSDFNKIGRSGHLTLYKNVDSINYLYKEDGALFQYDTVFTSPANYAFDERTGICRIAQKHKTKYLNIVGLRADIRVRTSRLEINGAMNYEKQVFYWEDGHLYRAYVKDNEILSDEYIYIHFQKKKLKKYCDCRKGAFYIGKQGFYEKTSEVKMEDFDRYNPKDTKVTQIRELVSYYFSKIVAYLKADKEQKHIWFCQKKIGNEVYE